jgi:hypothetical protein
MSEPSQRPLYQHTQSGTLMIASAVLAAIFVFYHLLQGGPTWLWGLLLLAAAVGVTFSSLTVVLTRTMFRASFAPGWPKKEEALANIVSVRTVRNPWYYGWGIRLTPKGILYNVSGLDAVEIRNKDGKTFRIGTNEPQKLQLALQNILQEN